MISSKKTTQALLAIQHLAKAARGCTDDRELDKAYTLLDTLEYLPTLILDKEDKTETFHGCLRDMTNRTPKANRALSVFENEPEEHYSKTPFFNS